MLSPPPSDSFTDKNALTTEGRQKYLNSLQNRLDRLEGRKHKLTSKDMLSALSEAKEDHLSSRNLISNSSSWGVADHTLQTDPALPNRSRLDQEQIDEDTTSRSTSLSSRYCCCCCMSPRGSNGRSQYYTRTSSEVSSNEGLEYACLVNCDELELNQMNEEET